MPSRTFTGNGFDIERLQKELIGATPGNKEPITIISAVALATTAGLVLPKSTDLVRIDWPEGIEEAVIERVVSNHRPGAAIVPVLHHVQVPQQDHDDDQEDDQPKRRPARVPVPAARAKHARKRN